MTSQPTVLNPGQWHRAGRGTRRELPGLNPQDVAAVLSELPVAWGPYLLVSQELVKVGKKYEPLTRPVSPAELDVAAEQGEWQFFVVSETLSPGLVAALPHLSTADLATNGAINLQYRPGSKDDDEPSSLGHVPVVRTAAGEEVRFEEYAQIFDTAVKLARKLTRARRNA